MEARQNFGGSWSGNLEEGLVGSGLGIPSIDLSLTLSSTVCPCLPPDQSPSLFPSKKHPFLTSRLLKCRAFIRSRCERGMKLRTISERASTGSRESMM
jgi:hypothetical protein